MATKYLDKTIREIHVALMNGEVTSLDLVNEAIERINRDDCNSYEAKAFDKAIKKAMIEYLDDSTSNSKGGKTSS